MFGHLTVNGGIIDKITIKTARHESHVTLAKKWGGIIKCILFWCIKHLKYNDTPHQTKKKCNQIKIGGGMKRLMAST